MVEDHWLCGIKRVGLGKGPMDISAIVMYYSTLSPSPISHG